MRSFQSGSRSTVIHEDPEGQAKPLVARERSIKRTIRGLILGKIANFTTFAYQPCWLPFHSFIVPEKSAKRVRETSDPERPQGEKP